jgi:nitrogen PTS system EIIA component
MRLGDFILEEAITGELSSQAKGEVLAEMVNTIVEAGCLAPQDAESVVEALRQREEIGSTGIGHGVAIPHAKHPAVRRLLGAYAHSSVGVNYESLDGKPVKSIFLVLWPDGVIGPHLEAIAQISQILRRGDLLDLLKGTGDRKQIVELLARADRETEG